MRPSPSQTYLPNTSGALMKVPSEGIILGEGPFTESETPTGDCSFYVNSFDLADHRPWKTPATWRILDETSKNSTQTIPDLPIQWTPPSKQAFARVFDEICNEINTSRLIKTVPTLTQLGQLPTDDSWQQLIIRCLIAPDHLLPFGYWDNNQGFCGASPEYLFKQTGNTLETMALAGTSRPENELAFTHDEKEIHEHEIVADALIASLSPFGQLTRSPRSILNLKKLIHFYSHLRLISKENHSPDFWTQLLHPTPALGSQPKTPKTMAQLYEWRRQLDCPAYFGAPFGLWYKGSFTSLVAIRGVHWLDRTLALTSGCGVVKNSQLPQEWRELKLKRDAIRQSLHLS
ncbi:MAG: chorismate-binding protein [Akkermansia sp.]